MEQQPGRAPQPNSGHPAMSYHYQLAKLHNAVELSYRRSGELAFDLDRIYREIIDVQYLLHTAPLPENERSQLLQSLIVLMNNNLFVINSNQRTLNQKSRDLCDAVSWGHSLSAQYAPLRAILEGQATFTLLPRPSTQVLPNQRRPVPPPARILSSSPAPESRARMTPHGNVQSYGAVPAGAAQPRFQPRPPPYYGPYTPFQQNFSQLQANPHAPVSQMHNQAQPEAVRLPTLNATFQSHKRAGTVAAEAQPKRARAQLRTIPKSSFSNGSGNLMPTHLPLQSGTVSATAALLSPAPSLGSGTSANPTSSATTPTKMKPTKDSAEEPVESPSVKSISPAPNTAASPTPKSKSCQSSKKLIGASVEPKQVGRAPTHAHEPWNRVPAVLIPTVSMQQLQKGDEAGIWRDKKGEKHVICWNDAIVVGQTDEEEEVKDTESVYEDEASEESETDEDD